MLVYWHIGYEYATNRIRNLCDTLSCIDDAEEVNSFLIDLCTPAELRALSERWQMARLLDSGGLSYRGIRAVTGVSTTTIGRVARFLKDESYQGYRRVLDHLKTHTTGH